MKEEKRLRDSLYIFLKSSVLTCYMLHATCYMLRPEKLSVPVPCSLKPRQALGGEEEEEFFFFYRQKK